MSLDLRTTEFVVQSSLHGAQRRSQRDISKRDLQAAVKYGVKEHGYPNRKTGEPRFMYKWAGVTYITDETSTIEVTSWADEIPMEKQPIPDRIQQQHDEAKRRILKDPTIIASHHVCVVDMSASMRKSDNNGHKSRFRAVYYSLAEEYTSSLLEKTAAFTGTDVVTLIEMRDTATVVFSLEPISPVLYNKFVELATMDKKYACSHGHYTSALECAFNILMKYDHSESTPSMFFLSDGCPSDPSMEMKYMYMPHVERRQLFKDDLAEDLQPYFYHFGSRLTFVACGYGKGGVGGDFDVMEALVDVAKSANVKEAKLLKLSLDIDALSNAMTSIISSTTETRTMLSRLGGTKLANHEARQLKVKPKDNLQVALSASTDISKFRSIFLNPAGQGVLYENSVDESHHGIQVCERFTIEYDGAKPKYKKVAFLHQNACGIAVKDDAYFGEGAERLVYLMTEIDSSGKPVGDPLVAKESKYIESKSHRSNNQSFHFNFMKTQHKARGLAMKFNRKLDQLQVSKSKPRMSFIECFVYYCRGKEGNFVEWLCEKRLNPTKYMKWNDNAGGVDGIKKLNANWKVQEEDAYIPQKERAVLDALEEDLDEDADSDDDEVSIDENNNANDMQPERVRLLEAQVLDSDIPQAFTHWTYNYSKRDRMVCDIQGELVATASGLMFECTDPCIHDKRADHRRTRHTDRTNKGAQGMHAFMKTHHCNALCEILKIKCH